MAVGPLIESIDSDTGTVGFAVFRFWELWLGSHLKVQSSSLEQQQ